VTEYFVGRAFGARDRPAFDGAVARSGEVAFMTSVLLAALVFFAGDAAVYGLTDHAEVRRLATEHVNLAALYVLVSFAAFQLDGIFIGASATRDMRNASALSTAVFLAAWWAIGQKTNSGLWLAFVIYVVARALALGAFFPGLRRRVAPLGG
jgi:MATE family multidrug resistance protein